MRLALQHPALGSSQNVANDAVAKVLPFLTF
jgi:hypothetical protein